MAGTWSNSMTLLKSSWSVLREHRSLVLFPIVSALVTIVMIAALAVPAVFLSGASDGEITNQVWFYVFFAIFYFICSFVVIFFNTGLVACAKLALQGQEPDFKYGLDVAWSNVGKVAGWALISATVGLILRIIRDQLGWVGEIITGLLGFVWNLIVFFVIPVYVFQGYGVFASIKESASIFKRTWGENVVARFGLGLVFFLLALIGILPIVAIAFTKNAALIIAVVAIVLMYWAVLAILSSSLTGILSTALYDYAVTGQVPAAYNPKAITGAFQPKAKKGRFGAR